MQSCRQDDFDTSPNLHLEFDTDSLLFDTVFTTVGSATRFFKVYNRQNSRVNISNLELAGGTSSYFRINADGRSGIRINDLEIGPNDSIFVFVEVTVDPVGQDLPLVIADSVVIDLNGNSHNVKLVAWGQDANFIRPNYTDTVNNISAHIITRNTTWSGPKPYVVYGLVLVAPGVSLNVERGTNVHLHNNSALIFYPESTFKVRGTLEEPVSFLGDRLESTYSDLPGQWGYIWLMATSRDHEIDYAIIKNATYGIVMDSIGSLTEPTLRIRNTIIENMDQTGLELNGAWVEGSNLVVANCGVHAIQMRWGGTYSFKHVTVANYYNLPGAIRQTPSVYVNNFYLDTLNVPVVRDFESIYFGNSIVYGSLQEEFQQEMYPRDTQANIVFDHCLVKSTFNTLMPDYFQNSFFNEQPRFNNIGDNDYRLLDNSPVIGRGSVEIALDIPFDILGNNRSDTIDLGAYQYYEIEEEED
jgi:hypothetical protein